MAGTTDTTNYYSKNFLLLYFSIFCAFLNSAINGYDLSLIGGVLILRPFEKAFGTFGGDPSKDKDAFGRDYTKQWGFTPNDKSILLAILQIGSVSGCFFVGPTADWLGRRAAMAIGSIIIIVGTILEIATNSLTIFMIGRFIIGFGVVFVTTSAPTYVVEVAHPIFRGRAGAFYNTGWHVGAIPASVITFAMVFIAGGYGDEFDKTAPNDLAWRLPCGLQAMWSGFVLLGCLVIPESPRWMYSKGKVEECRAFLTKYHANGDENAEIVVLQMKEIELAIAEEKSQSAGTYASLFANRANRYRSFLILCVAFFSQYAGNWVAGYFQSTIISYFGINDDAQKLLFNVVTGIISWISSLVGASLVDKVGRRTLLKWGQSSYVLWYLLIVLLVGYYKNWEVEPAPGKEGPISAGIAAFVFLQIFAICYSVSWTPMNSLYPVECLQYSNRAKGMAMCQLLINAASVIQSYVLSYGFAAYKWKFFSFFLLFNLGAAICIWMFFPETKGRTLEEMDEIFQAPNPVKKSLEPPASAEVAVATKEVV